MNTRMMEKRNEQMTDVAEMLLLCLSVAIDSLGAVILYMYNTYKIQTVHFSPLFTTRHASHRNRNGKTKQQHLGYLGFLLFSRFHHPRIHLFTCDVNLVFL